LQPKIPTNSGSFAVFPCSESQISDWISGLTEITANNLFEKETNPSLSMGDTEHTNVSQNNGGPCDPECENENWDDICSTNTYTANNTEDSIWGDAQSVDYNYVRVNYHRSTCGPSCEPDDLQRDYATFDLEMKWETKTGFKLTPLNGGSVPISYWATYTYDEEAEMVSGFFGTHWSINASASSVGSFIFGGENNYLTPPETLTQNCVTDPCSATMYNPNPWSDDCAYDWEGGSFATRTFPYECDPEVAIGYWPDSVYYKAHYFDEEKAKGIIQIFSYVPDYFEEMEVYVSIGDDPDEEPVDVPQNVVATAAVLALMQTGDTPAQARISSVKYFI